MEAEPRTNEPTVSGEARAQVAGETQEAGRAPVRRDRIVFSGQSAADLAPLRRLRSNSSRHQGAARVADQRLLSRPRLSVFTVNYEITKCDIMFD